MLSARAPRREIMKPDFACVGEGPHRMKAIQRGVPMKYQRILVPYDGSSHSQSALSLACSIAKESEGATVYVVNVVPMTVTPAIALNDPSTGAASTFADKGDFTQQFDNVLLGINHDMEQELSSVVEGLPKNRVVMEAVADPSPVNGLVSYAQERNCDLVVMGRRGLGAIRGMLGSVSYGLLRAVDIPVLTVK